MRRIAHCLLAFGFLAFSSAAMAQMSVIETVAEACAAETASYCSQVTPGQGRLLACFYAHEDKLSIGCLNALYEGMATLDLVVSELAHIEFQCRQDILDRCGEVVPGEGRIASCLVENKSELSAPCAAAIDEAQIAFE